jgi:hypothetical protein
VEQEEVNISVGGHGFEHSEVAGWQAGQAENGDPQGEGQHVGPRYQRGGCGGEAFSEARYADPPAQPAKKLALPRGICRLIAVERPTVPFRSSLEPAEQHLRTVDGIMVVEVCDVADGGEPAGGSSLWRRAGGSQVVGEGSQELLSQAFVHDPEEWPYEAARVPGVFGGGVQPVLADRHPRRGSGGHLDESAWEGPVDIRADPVGSACFGTETVREALCQPALDAARRDGNDLARHRVLERLGEHVPERADEHVGALGAVDVEHAT